jgi:hypothetical protein
VSLSHGGVVFVIRTDDFSGTPDELLGQVSDVATAVDEKDAFQVTGPRSTVTTRTGQVGVAEHFTSVRSDGRIIAFVIGGTGVEVQVVGAPGQVAALDSVVTAMIESIGPRAGSEGGTR